MEQVQKKKSSTKQEEEVTQEVPLKENSSSDVDQNELDDFLDEIDDLLEENAETFVKEYQQRGGE